MRRFCSVCGKGTEKLVEGLCQECLCKEKEILRLPGELEIEVCRGCLRYWSKGRWLEVGGGIEEVLKSAAEREVREAMVVDGLGKWNAKVHVEGIRQKGKGTFHITCSGEVKGEVAGVNYSKRKEVLVRGRVVQCTRCSRAAGGYFEAILQVRGESLGEEDKRDMLERVEAGIASFSGEGAFISKSKVLRNGIDVYIGSLSAARKVAAGLRERYGGQLKESPKLVGRDRGSGKDIYRVSVLLRLSGLGRGDVISFKGRDLEIERITKNTMFCRELKGGKRVSLSLKAAEKARKRN